jgi:hypothetical protein
MTTTFVSHGGWIGSDTCMEEGRPWIRPGAAEYIESKLPGGANVFEYGAGASTIWLARMGCYVTSIEVDHEWYVAVIEWLAKEGLSGNARVLDFSPPSKLDICDAADFILKSFDEAYDMVLVDGRSRNRCIGNARSKVKVGGMLVLDNSERAEYAAGVALMDTWTGFEYGDEGWSSVVWFRKQESDAERVELECEDA